MVPGVRSCFLLSPAASAGIGAWRARGLRHRRNHRGRHRSPGSARLGHGEGSFGCKRGPFGAGKLSCVPPAARSRWHRWSCAHSSRVPLLPRPRLHPMAVSPSHGAGSCGTPPCRDTRTASGCGVSPRPPPAGDITGTPPGAPRRRGAVLGVSGRAPGRSARCEPPGVPGCPRGGRSRGRRSCGAERGRSRALRGDGAGVRAVLPSGDRRSPPCPSWRCPRGRERCPPRVRWGHGDTRPCAVGVRLPHALVPTRGRRARTGSAGGATRVPWLSPQPPAPRRPISRTPPSRCPRAAGGAAPRTGAAVPAWLLPALLPSSARRCAVPSAVLNRSERIKEPPEMPRPSSPPPPPHPGAAVRISSASLLNAAPSEGVPANGPRAN